MLIMSRKHRKSKLQLVSKICPCCKEEKDGTHFGWRVEQKGWLNSYCKLCQRLKAKEQRKKPEHKDYQRKYFATEHGKEVRRRGQRAYYQRKKSH